MTIADDLDKAMANFKPGGISQPDLAKLSGVPQPTISRTLKGKSTPETYTLIKLARALRCVLGGYTGTEDEKKSYLSGNVTELKVAEEVVLPKPIDEIISLAKTMSAEGQYVLLGRAQEVALLYPKAKKNHSS